MTEDPQVEVSLHPNPAYCTVDYGALQPHTPGSSDCHIYEDIPVYMNMKQCAVFMHKTQHVYSYTIHAEETLHCST